MMRGAQSSAIWVCWRLFPLGVELSRLVVVVNQRTVIRARGVRNKHQVPRPPDVGHEQQQSETHRN